MLWIGQVAVDEKLAVINVNSSVTVVDTVSETALKSWIAHDDGALALTWHPKLPLFATSCQGVL